MAMCEGQRLMMSFRTPCSCLTVIALHSSGMRSRNSFRLSPVLGHWQQGSLLRAAFFQLSGTTRSKTRCPRLTKCASCHLFLDHQTQLKAFGDMCVGSWEFKDRRFTQSLVHETRGIGAFSENAAASCVLSCRGAMQLQPQKESTLTNNTTLQPPPIVPTKVSTPRLYPTLSTLISSKTLLMNIYVYTERERSSLGPRSKRQRHSDSRCSIEIA